MPLTGFDDIQSSLTPEEKLRAKRLANWLKEEGRIISGVEICRQGKLPANRIKLRQMISYLRSLGDPAYSLIASDQRGYWWEADAEKCIDNVQHLKQRADKEMAAFRGVCQALGVDSSLGLGDVERG